MVAGIFALFEALPKILLLMERIGQWITDRNLNSWLDDVEKTIDALETAQTPEDKRKAARNLVGLVRSIR